MKRTICNQVRLEIEHKHLVEPLSVDSDQHINECADCREFQSKLTKLRQIVASLEPVNAPPDFDFKLRARLVNANGAGTQLFASPVKVWRWRSLAVAAMLLIFAATVLMIRQTEQQEQPSSLGQQATIANADLGRKAGTDSSGPSHAADQQEESTKEETTLKPGVKRGVTPSPVNKRPTVAVDFSSSTAPVVRDQQSLATMPSFPLEVSQRSFTVSLDDGRGSSRTISVPAVSFGSRRVLTSGNMQANQFVPKGDW